MEKAILRVRHSVDANFNNGRVFAEDFYFLQSFRKYFSRENSVTQ